MNATKHRITVIYGEDDYLRRQAELKVSANFSSVINLDPQHLTPDELITRCCQRDLFQHDTQLYVLRNKDEQRSLWKALNAARIKLHNALLFVCRKKTLSTTLQKMLDELKVQTIHCPTPRPHEYGKHLQRICEQHSLQLDSSGRRLLLENCGLQLEALANEVQKLALIFSTRNLSAADIAPHLGLLREDSSFAIIDLLLHKKYNRAQLVVEKLLQRGESALAVLGVLAYFLRNVVQASEGQLKLAPRQITRYQNFTRNHQLSAALTVLSLCQQADMDLKSTRIRPELVLASLLDALAKNFP